MSRVLSRRPTMLAVSMDRRRCLTCSLAKAGVLPSWGGESGTGGRKRDGSVIGNMGKQKSRLT